MNRRLAGVVACAVVVSALGVALAQVPDCTSQPCVYVPVALNVSPEPAATAAPLPTVTPTRDPAQCAEEYPTVCIPPPPPDLNCPDIPYRNFPALPPDRHHFDTDRDGVGCEQ